MGILLLASSMHLNSYIIEEETLIYVVAFTNIVMSLPSFLKIQNRHDGDFHAYLNQAGAFLSG